MKLAEDKYNYCYSRRKISKMLKQIHEGHLEVLIWQTIEGKRRQLRGRIKRIDANNERIIAYVFLGEFRSLKKNYPLYMYSEKLDAVFKMKITDNSYELQFTFPKEMYFLEKRIGNRIDTNNRYNSEALLVVESEYNKKMSPRYTVSMIDLSSEGLAFRITGHHLGTIKKDNVIYIESISGLVLKKNIECRVKYVEEEVNVGVFGASKTFRAGVKFERQLLESTINRISQRLKLASAAS